MTVRKKRRIMCPFHGCDGRTPGRIWMWGMVTHKHRVKVCPAHEGVYRDYGWIRVRTKREKGEDR
jgi:hypothetical protein